jgi:diguanylate cyclase (GGDEF)-like protein
MDTDQRTSDAQPEFYSLAQIRHLLRVEFGRAQRYGYPINVLMLSIDQLGALRDAAGYEAKEAAIETVVELLHVQTRGSDLVGRLPDDRLLIIVPHTPPAQIEVLVTRLLQSVRELEPAAGGKLSLSAGVSFCEAGGTLFHDELLRCAEAALAESVGAGGDRWTERLPGSAG